MILLFILGLGAAAIAVWLKLTGHGEERFIDSAQLIQVLKAEKRKDTKP